MTTGRPATGPVNVTTPGAAARTSAPAVAARSTPRWPAPHGRAGGSKRPITAPGPPPGPSTGHRRPPPVAPSTPGPPGPPEATESGPASPAAPATAPSAHPALLTPSDPVAACPSAPGRPPVSRTASTTGTTSSTRRPAATLAPAPLPLPAGAAPAPEPTVTPAPAPAVTPAPAPTTSKAMRPRLPGPARPGHPGPVSCGQPAPGDNGRPSNGWTPAGARGPNTVARVPRTWPVPARPPSRSRSALGASRTLHTRPGPPGRLRTPRHRRSDSGSAAAPARCECRSVRRARPVPGPPGEAARHVRGVRRGCHLAVTDKTEPDPAVRTSRAGSAIAPPVTPLRRSRA
ncbi:hypothetical protein KPATCC21470_5680 [Kitasatospora purpeofusca]